MNYTPYRPHVSGDKNYLKGVKDTIAERGELGPIKFDRLNIALQSLGIEEDPYATLSLEDLNTAAVQQLVADSFARIHESNLSPEAEEKLKALWDYLAEEDEVKPADLIFVFGGPGTARVERAAELYKQGVAPKILFSGKQASYLPTSEDVTEAEYYRGLAMEAGVAPADIITETEARNTPENASNSVRILKADGFKPKTIIGITLPYHMRRSWLTLRSAADWNPTVRRQAVPSAKFKRDDYYLDFNGWSYIFNEYIKIYGARLMKHF